VYAKGNLVAQQSRDGQFYWSHTNHLDSGIKMTDSTGAMKQRTEFAPYGQALLEWSASGDTYLNTNKFTGYERDETTGLDYARARTYMNGRGRFSQPDPIKLKMDELARTFTWWSGASLTDAALSVLRFEHRNGPIHGSDGFAAPFYEAPYADGVRADQVQHTVAGLLVGYIFGDEEGLRRMNDRENANDQAHGIPDININRVSVPMGAKLAGNDWKASAKDLGSWIRGTLCEPPQKP
jgi:RHS repeat-associated protein